MKHEFISQNYTKSTYIKGNDEYCSINPHLFFKSRSQYRASNSGDREDARGPWVMALLLTNLPQACIVMCTKCRTYVRSSTHTMKHWSANFSTSPFILTKIARAHYSIIIIRNAQCAHARDQYSHKWHSHTTSPSVHLCCICHGQV